MKNQMRIHPRLVATIACIILVLATTTIAIASGNIDPVHKYAWGASAGWINFSTDTGGVSVYADHLEGYAWGENIGWIRVGTHQGGGAFTYANTTATDYGVNRASNGSLSGYAWSPNVGWINFSPANGGVIIDPASGVFDGYAWGENAGWIKFKGADYGLVTTYRISQTYLPIMQR